MITASISAAHIRATLDILRTGGLRGHERVVLWLGPARGGPNRICEVFEPEQETAKDYFRLPPRSMSALMTRLRTGRLKVVAQIHTHPGRAYHSDVDAEWAIVRQVGALSLVLPRFASATTLENFQEQVMTYECAPDGTWVLVANTGPQARLEITA